MIVFDLKERKKKDTFNQIDLLENWSSIPTICEVLFYLLIYQQLDNITGLISSHNLKKPNWTNIFMANSNHMQKCCIFLPYFGIVS